MLNDGMNTYLLKNLSEIVFVNSLNAGVLIKEGVEN